MAENKKGNCPFCDGLGELSVKETDEVSGEVIETSGPCLLCQGTGNM